MNREDQKNNNNNNLDASFVHLLSPLLLESMTASTKTTTKSKASATPLLSSRNKNHTTIVSHRTNNNTSSSSLDHYHHAIQQQPLSPFFVAGNLMSGGSFLESHCHLEDLLRAAQGRALPGLNHDENDERCCEKEQHHENDAGVYLCLDCIEWYVYHCMMVDGVTRERCLYISFFHFKNEPSFSVSFIFNFHFPCCGT